MPDESQAQDGGAPTDYDAALAAERSVNERYLKRLLSLVAGSATIGRTIATSRSQAWLGDGPSAKISGRIVSPLVGRVALADDDPDLGTNFYIGAWRDESDDVQVVCWAAPVASVFFEGRQATHELASATVARRTFESSGDDLVAFDDVEDVRSADREPFPLASAPLAVPAPPKAVVRPPVLRPTAPAPPEEARASVASSRPGSIDDGAVGESGGLTAEPESPEDRRAALRAEPLVRRAIERPRTGALRSVLATLQPDQFRLVTWPHDRPLIVQGQPGTGKTIVATHRVGYLTHAENEGRLRRVALVGPTDAYADHVRGVERQVGGQDVAVLGLEGLMRELTGFAGVTLRSSDARPEDVDWQLGSLLERCARALKRADLLTGSPTRQHRFLVEAVRDGSDALAHLLSGDARLDRWRRQLPSWEEMVPRVRYRPFLAAAAQAVGIKPVGPFDHLVVDEAQDLHPLEWRILSKLLLPGGSWSIFGDMNQRHSDWTTPDWEQVATDLELTDDAGGFAVETLDIGYRSTREILKFANRLLPRGERAVHALREGVPPRVVRCGLKQVTAIAVEQAEQLSSRHADGITAVITTRPSDYAKSLARRGWKRRAQGRGWQNEDRFMTVLLPDRARGLEFDAVVVVEPSEFPQNLGRSGPLYTSLTRATKELVVVHAKAMPKELQGAARS